MGLRFKVVNDVLPVGREDVFVGAVKTLIDLFACQYMASLFRLEGKKSHTFAQAPV
jgi:hypothetical protein